MTRISTSKFWDWSLTHYQKDEVEPALLRLQDEHGLDANLLLWACWCATSFNALPEALMRDAIAKISPWATNVTIPLRNTRRALKSILQNNEVFGAEALRVAIKQNELSAEKISQEQLETLVVEMLRTDIVDPNDARSRAMTNLLTYTALAEVSGNQECINALLESLTGHIFADTPQEVCSKDDHGE